MSQLLNRALRATRRYTLWDYAFLKITLVSLGVLMGAYFAEFFLHHTFLLWIIFLVSYLCIMFRTFISHRY